MSATRHPLLVRQLRRLGIDPETAPPNAGKLAELLVHVSRAYTDADQGRYLLERSQDVSSREMGELYAQLKASQARMASLLSLSSDWVWETDAAMRITYVSEHVARIGFNAADLIGRRQSVRELPPLPDSDPDAYQAHVDARRPFRNFTFGLHVPDGRLVYLRMSGEPVFEADVFKGYRGVASDITQATLAERQVQHLARYDSLTGLANRTTLQDELGRTLERARCATARFAVMFIDLDRFKTVNDTLGHESGDELLKVMASRLSALLRGTDLLARLGGDEFVVLVSGKANEDGLSRMAGRILGAVREPLDLGGRTVQLSGSIGIAIYPTDGADPATLLKNADTAMYQAKSRGRNNFQFFTEQLARSAARRFALEADLRRALSNGELRVHYQPTFRTEGGLCGAEALIRWQHPQLGLLSPGEFIGLAEETGLIGPIGRWVIEEVCRQIRAWRDAGLTVPRCAINLSPSQFASEDPVECVEAALRSARLQPQALGVEITESLIMTDPLRAQRALQRLHDRGVCIAIDDFGTGYSSLAYLKHFPAHTIKLDRSFVAGLPADPGDAAITKAVIAMAHSLQMQVVAEGVETREQLAFLHTQGCDKVQGYLLGRPMPPDAFSALLAAPREQAVELQSRRRARRKHRGSSFGS